VNDAGENNAGDDITPTEPVLGQCRTSPAPPQRQHQHGGDRAWRVLAIGKRRAHGKEGVEDRLLGQYERVVRETERASFAVRDRDGGGDRRDEPERVVAGEVLLGVAR
jgi:hypothetical protein